MVRGRIFCLLVVIFGLSGCGGSKEEEPAVKAPPSIQLQSSAFAAGGAIPQRYSCDGEDTSPPLGWSGVPDNAKSLALLMDDPDAPGGTYTHWTVYAISPTTQGFEEGKTTSGARQGENSFGDVGYGGPCPPEGSKAHRYVFALYALRQDPGVTQGAKPDEVRSAIEKHAIARGRLVGTFKRG